VKRSVRGEMLRRAVADEAARLMIEHGLDDFGTAKRKAAERFGVTEHSVLPKNAEIESALADRQRLFGADRHAQDLAALRQAARDAMRLLAGFDPRLVGPVLSGTATRHSEIELHVFADSVEAIAVALLDARVAHKLDERRLRPRSQRDESVAYPAIRFHVAGYEVEATVFPEVGMRQAPISPVDGRPMRRANAAEVEILLAAAIDQVRPAGGT
jgi:hypothetical protein